MAIDQQPITKSQQRVTNNEPLPPELASPRWLGWINEFRADPLGLLRRAAAKGDHIRMRLGPSDAHFINHPDYIKHVLQDHNRNYSKNTRTIKNIREFSGESIFTGEGEFWLQRRRLMQPMFHKQAIAGFGAVMSSSAREMMERWDAAPSDQPLDMDAEMIKVTLQIVGKSLFSIDLLADANALGAAFGEINEYIIFRAQHPFHPPIWFPTGQNRRARTARASSRRVIERIINDRLAHGSDAHDLLSLLMSMRDEETGAGLTADELGRETVTMVFAGHETTSNTLTWAWYLLSQHPTITANLHAELDAVLESRAPTIDDVPNLVYTRQVIDETLRLYPAAWITARQSVAADVVGGMRIPADTVILISPYTMHRHTHFWHDPDTFDPERFAPGAAERRPRFAYLPFGGGPRLCIGQPFALAEAVLILATVAQRYTLSLAPTARVEPLANVTLSVKHGLPIYITRRHGTANG